MPTYVSISIIYLQSINKQWCIKIKRSAFIQRCTRMQVHCLNAYGGRGVCTGACTRCEMICVICMICDKFIMNSLRTDDIRGAMPRVRHMPKNLIRELKYPTRYSTNLQPYPLKNAYNQYPQHPNISHKQTLNQLQHPQPYELNSPRSSQRESIVSNYSPQRESIMNNYSKMGAPNYSQMDAPPRMAPSPTALNRLPKSELGNGRIKSSSTHNPEMPESNNLLPIKEQQIIKPIVQNHQLMPNQKSSKQSPPTPVAPTEPKKFFRGLGFNIITNNKFEYVFENSYSK